MTNKRLTKPYEKNVRLDSPLGLLGVPPDANGETYVLVTNDITVKQVVDKLMMEPKHYYPQ